MKKTAKEIAKRTTADEVIGLKTEKNIKPIGRNEAAVLGASGNNVGDATVALLLTHMFPNLET